MGEALEHQLAEIEALCAKGDGRPTVADADRIFSGRAWVDLVLDDDPRLSPAVKETLLMNTQPNVFDRRVLLRIERALLRHVEAPR